VEGCKALRTLGSTVHAVRNRGYCLQLPVSLWMRRHPRSAVARSARRLRHMEVAWTVTSTNTVLLERGPAAAGRIRRCVGGVSERGPRRRGAAPGSRLRGRRVSIDDWTFAQVPRDVGSLSLAIGCAWLRALGHLGIADLQLKMANDVLRGDAKLGGILIELRAEAAGPACVVIGIGLNVALGAALAAQISARNCGSGFDSAGGAAAGAQCHAAQVIESCIAGLLDFERDGLRTFMDEWRHADALRGRTITVSTAMSAPAASRAGLM